MAATVTGGLHAPEAIHGHEAHTIAVIAIHQLNHHRRHHKRPQNKLMMVLQQHRIKNMQKQQQQQNYSRISYQLHFYLIL